MQFKKEPCRNFQRGHCRFGETCRYLHVTQQQPKASFFGTQIGSNQQQKPNAFGFGAQTVSYQQQKPNPFGFGVQNSSQSKGATDFGSKLNQSKLSQNTWTRSTSTPAGGASRLPDNHSQASNHKCTDPEACRRQIVEDFECERPLWKLTCYSHSKELRNPGDRSTIVVMGTNEVLNRQPFFNHKQLNKYTAGISSAPCDIVGDVSYEELRTAAYDDARRGLSFQSIVERERNLLNSKLVEFDNLLNKLYAFVPNSTPANQIPSSGARPNAVPLTVHNSAPPSVSSFSQLGASQNMGVGIRPSTPSNNALRQLNPNPNSSLTSSTFGTNNFQYRSEVTSQMPSQTSGSSFTSNVAGFSNSGNINSRSNTFSSPTGPAQISSSTSNNSSIISNGPNFHVTGSESTDVQLMTNLQMVHVSGNLSIWLKEKWNPGEIPEEAPPDEFV